MFRSMAKSKAAIAKSGCPEFTRYSFQGSYIVMLCVAIPLAIAAVIGFAGGDPATTICVMSSPVILLLGYMEIDKRWRAKHPELVSPAMKGVQARVEQLAAWQKSGQISQREYIKRTKEMWREALENDSLGR